MNPTTIINKVILFTALVSVLVQFSTCLRLESWNKSPSLPVQGSGDDESVPVLKEALRDLAERHIADLQALEDYIDHQIAELQRRKTDIQRKKRGHFACRVHAIACYKKRSQDV